MPPTLLAIGRVTRPHGVRGELKVQPYWSGSQSLREVSRVVLRVTGGESVSFAVERVRELSRGQLLKVAGVDDLDAAEGWRGAEVLVERSLLPPLASGEYFLVDLVGVEVVGPEGEIGVVVEVRPYPTVDAVVVEDREGRRRELPLLEPWLAEVDVENRVIRLTSCDGFLD